MLTNSRITAWYAFISRFWSDKYNIAEYNLDQNFAIFASAKLEELQTHDDTSTNLQLLVAENTAQAAYKREAQLLASGVGSQEATDTALATFRTAKEARRAVIPTTQWILPRLSSEADHIFELAQTGYNSSQNEASELVLFTAAKIKAQAVEFEEKSIKWLEFYQTEEETIEYSSNQFTQNPDPVAKFGYFSDGTYGPEINRLSPEGLLYGDSTLVQKEEKLYWWDTSKWTLMPTELDQTTDVSLLPNDRYYGEIWRVSNSSGGWDFYLCHNTNDWRKMKQYWTIEGRSNLPSTGHNTGDFHKVIENDVPIFWNSYEWSRYRIESMEGGQEVVDGVSDVTSRATTLEGSHSSLSTSYNNFVAPTGEYYTTKASTIQALEDLDETTDALGVSVHAIFSPNSLTKDEANALRSALKSVQAESVSLIADAEAVKVWDDSAAIIALAAEVGLAQTDYSDTLAALVLLITPWITPPVAPDTYPIAVDASERSDIEDLIEDLQGFKTVLVTKINALRQLKAENTATTYTNALELEIDADITVINQSIYDISDDGSISLDEANSMRRLLESYQVDSTALLAIADIYFEETDSEWAYVTTYNAALENLETVFASWIPLVKKWATGVVRIIGDYVSPPSLTGFNYECVGPGTSGTEPVWPVVLNAEVQDNNVTWKCIPLVYPIAIAGSVSTRAEVKNVLDDMVIAKSKLTAKISEVERANRIDDITDVNEAHAALLTDVTNAGLDGWVSDQEAKNLRERLATLQVEANDLELIATDLSVTTEWTDYGGTGGKLELLATALNSWINAATYPVEITGVVTTRANVQTALDNVAKSQLALTDKFGDVRRQLAIDAAKTYIDTQISEVNGVINALAADIATSFAGETITITSEEALELEANRDVVQDEADDLIAVAVGLSVSTVAFEASLTNTDTPPDGLFDLLNVYIDQDPGDYPISVTAGEKTAIDVALALLRTEKENLVNAILQANIAAVVATELIPVNTAIDDLELATSIDRVTQKDVYNLSNLLKQMQQQESAIIAIADSLWESDEAGYIKMTAYSDAIDDLEVLLDPFINHTPTSDYPLTWDEEDREDINTAFGDVETARATLEAAIRNADREYAANMAIQIEAVFNDEYITKDEALGLKANYNRMVAESTPLLDAAIGAGFEADSKYTDYEDAIAALWVLLEPLIDQESYPMVLEGSEDEADGSLNPNTDYATADMISNNNPSPNSVYGYYTGTSYPYKAFDQDTTTYWYRNQLTVDNNNPICVMFDFGPDVAKIINKYQFHVPTVYKPPVSWVLQGSNSSLAPSNWHLSIPSTTNIFTTLHTVTDAALENGGWTEYFTFSNANSYRYYRLVIVTIDAGHNVALSEIKLVNALTGTAFNRDSITAALDAVDDAKIKLINLLSDNQYTRAGTDLDNYATRVYHGFTPGGTDEWILGWANEKTLVVNKSTTSTSKVDKQTLDSCSVFVHTPSIQWKNETEVFALEAMSAGADPDGPEGPLLPPGVTYNVYLADGHPLWDTSYYNYQNKLFCSLQTDNNGLFETYVGGPQGKLFGTVDVKMDANNKLYFEHNSNIDMAGRVSNSDAALWDHSNFDLFYDDSTTLILRRIDGQFGQMAIGGKLYYLGQSKSVATTGKRISVTTIDYVEVMSLDETEIEASTLYYVYIGSDNLNYNLNDTDPLTELPFEVGHGSYVDASDFRCQLFLSTKEPEEGRLADSGACYWSRHIGLVWTDADKKFIYSNNISAIRQKTLNPEYFDGLAEIDIIATDNTIAVATKGGTSGTVLVNSKTVLTEAEGAADHTIDIDSKVWTYSSVATPPLTDTGDTVKNYVGQTLYVYLTNDDPCWVGYVSQTLVITDEPTSTKYLSFDYPGNNARWLYTIVPSPADIQTSVVTPTDGLFISDDNWDAGNGWTINTDTGEASYEYTPNGRVFVTTADQIDCSDWTTIVAPVTVNQTTPGDATVSRIFHTVSFDNRVTWKIFTTAWVSIARYNTDHWEYYNGSAWTTATDEAEAIELATTTYQWEKVGIEALTAEQWMSTDGWSTNTATIDWATVSVNGTSYVADGANNTSTNYATVSMTGNTTGTSVASASSFYNATYPAWKAFDNLPPLTDTASAWISADINIPPSINNPESLVFDFGEGNAKCINKYRLRSRSSTTPYFPLTWQIQASNDALAVAADPEGDHGWTTLDFVPDGPNIYSWAWTPYYNFENNEEYQKYRIRIIGRNGTQDCVSIDTFHLVEATTTSTSPNFENVNMQFTLTEEGAPTYLSHNINVAAGAIFMVTFTTTEYVSGSITPSLAGGNGTAVSESENITQHIVSGNGGVGLYFIPSEDFIGKIKEVSYSEVMSASLPSSSIVAATINQDIKIDDTSNSVQQLWSSSKLNNMLDVETQSFLVKYIEYEVQSRTGTGVRIEQTTNVIDYDGNSNPNTDYVTKPMSGNVVPTPQVAFCSSQYSSYSPYKAFNQTCRDKLDCWLTNAACSVAAPQTITIDLGSAKIINKYAMQSRFIKGFFPIDFKLYGSVLGSTWVELASAVNVTQPLGAQWWPGPSLFAAFTNSVAYRYYRIAISKRPNSYVAISNIKLVEYTPGTSGNSAIKIVSNTDTLYFDKYGKNCPIVNNSVIEVTGSINTSYYVYMSPVGELILSINPPNRRYHATMFLNSNIFLGWCRFSGLNTFSGWWNVFSYYDEPTRAQSTAISTVNTIIQTKGFILPEGKRAILTRTGQSWRSYSESGYAAPIATVLDRSNVDVGAWNNVRHDITALLATSPPSAITSDGIVAPGNHDAFSLGHTGFKTDGTTYHSSFSGQLTITRYGN